MKVFLPMPLIALYVLCAALAAPVVAQQPPPVPPGARDVVRKGAEDRCYRPRTVRDLDTRRMADVIGAGRDLCLQLRRVADGPVAWRFTIIRNRTHPDGPVWAVLHDDEDAAFEAGVHAVRRYGGAMIAVDTDEARFNGGLDPNHSFAATAGQAAPCRVRAAPAYTAEVLDMFPPGAPVLSLHSNHEGHRLTGGLGDISAAVSAGGRHGLPTGSPKGALSDPDNVVLIPGRVPYVENRAAQAAARYFDGLGINVIYERVGRSDCSLSHHVTLVRGGPYYNIEVQHGAAAVQGQIIDALMGWLGVVPVPGG
ncbi:hypothetical protein ATO6_19645 [Oceanicola sp. 22II-s10i]|uniref:hypothetical protein n=1 Tax=Oceanicola sp. 22II-s10i TaxID=1317116 RepID=UPI000B524CC0|nr:hypothetical protein [Oceanicola sp. 22II-s10i]OWU83344.1 hypothetical protein ATO6_19645 [Oceanicola sp. 22II-s10i]